jgi:glucokinase
MTYSATSLALVGDIGGTSARIALGDRSERRQQLIYTQSLRSTAGLSSGIAPKPGTLR